MSLSALFLLSQILLQQTSHPVAAASPTSGQQRSGLTIQGGIKLPLQARLNTRLSKGQATWTSSAHLSTCQPTQPTRFLVFGGGGSPKQNEIALEKNVLYFQRTLQALGHQPQQATVFFANGNDGRATVRYLDPNNRERYKVPQIPGVQGATSLNNLQAWMQQTKQAGQPANLFFYFTGHGALNEKDNDNNGLILWQNRELSVQSFSRLLDQLPRDSTVVTMMAQCYAGSFANFIYDQGNPQGSIALQTRCGFFATIKTQPSVGCTPAVNEADYRDYSSSFFAGLSGRARTGESVTSADYNQDGRISYSEAHAFAKVDERSTDLPISTSEAWLQKQATAAQQQAVVEQPIAHLLQTARPEQSYVIQALVQIFGLNLQKSYADNIKTLEGYRLRSDEQEAYLVRLGMELLNVSMEQQIRQRGDRAAVEILDRLLKCESESWRHANL